MAVGYIFNGMFNTVMLGLPTYWWAIILGFLLLGMSNLMWYNLFWKPLAPFHGLYKAYTTQKDAAFLGNLNNSLKLVSEQEAKVIFNESIDEAKKGERDWADTISGQIGVVGTDIILDTDNWTKRTTDEHYRIEELADAWNIEHPDDQVRSYSKFVRYIENGNIECDIPSFVVIDWTRIENALPRERLKSAFAGYVRQLAERMDDAELNKLNNVGMWMLGGSIVISIIFALGKFIMHKP